jgi:two-component system cell cycle response regulator DivK
LSKTKPRTWRSVAGNKQAALELARNDRFDLILMDIGIPNSPNEGKNDSGGLEAARELKSDDSTKSIPIIALTAHAMLDDKKRFVDAGCDAVQTKPYVFTDLLAEIEKRLAGKT